MGIVCKGDKYMNNEDLLLQIACDLFDTHYITLDTPREDVENWDSLAHVMLIATFAEKFKISIPIEKANGIERLRDLMDYAK